MRDLKTTLPAIVAAAAGFIAFSPEDFHAYPVLVHLAKYIMSGGLAVLGINAAQVSRNNAPK